MEALKQDLNQSSYLNAIKPDYYSLFILSLIFTFYDKGRFKMALQLDQEKLLLCLFGSAEGSSDYSLWAHLLHELY